MGSTSKWVEWPPGSGRRAFYDPAEFEEMAGVLAAARAHGDEAVKQEMGIIHEAKLALGLRAVDLTGRPSVGDIVIDLRGSDVRVEE